MKLKQVGFFKELRHGEPDGPSLRESASSEPCNDEALLAYLNSGELYIASPGTVKDVLSDSGEVIGTASLLTDGEWVWPQDLVYYKRNYNVPLPDMFLAHMAENNWEIPTVNLSELEL